MSVFHLQWRVYLTLNQQISYYRGNQSPKSLIAAFVSSALQVHWRFHDHTESSSAWIGWESQVWLQSNQASEYAYVEYLSWLQKQASNDYLSDSPKVDSDNSACSRCRFPHTHRNHPQPLGWATALWSLKFQNHGASQILSWASVFMRRGTLMAKQ